MGLSSTDTLVPVSLFLANLESLRGLPYIWGGKDAHGLDCSGCVTFALLQSGGPDLREFHNCNALIQECVAVPPLDYVPGLLLFYGPVMSCPSHVMVSYTGSGVGALCAYGSCGGGHLTTTVEAARAIGACVKEKSTLAYRRDFLGAYRWSRLDYTR